MEGIAVLWSNFIDEFLKSKAEGNERLKYIETNIKNLYW
jgi:hypothetical protein